MKTIISLIGRQWKVERDPRSLSWSWFLMGDQSMHGGGFSSRKEAVSHLTDYLKRSLEHAEKELLSSSVLCKWHWHKVNRNLHFMVDRGGNFWTVSKIKSKKDTFHIYDNKTRKSCISYNPDYNKILCNLRDSQDPVEFPL